jgi:toxin ParE1/3/4
LLDIDAIEKYSVQQWGQRVADSYLDGLNAGLQRLAESPGLLRERPGQSLRLRFYAVQRHVFVADVVGEHVYVLAVWHGSMDLAARLADLEPQLVYEAQLLHARISRSSG